MSTPISGAGSSIQLLKAQQAWAARQTSRPSEPAPAPSDESQNIASPIEMATAATTPSLGSVAQSRLSRAIPEIQEIARRAGFVGVSAQDIQRAYSRGESLLTDYRV